MIHKYEYNNMFLNESEMNLHDKNPEIYKELDDFSEKHQCEITVIHFVSALSKNPDQMYVDFELRCDKEITRSILDEIYSRRYLVPMIFHKDLLDIEEIKRDFFSSRR